MNSGINAHFSITKELAMYSEDIRENVLTNLE
jgi:hypothetical protein